MLRMLKNWWGRIVSILPIWRECSANVLTDTKNSDNTAATPSNTTKANHRYSPKTYRS
jgi:hypothetical protein